MGAWGLGVFENDCATDWIEELLESSGLAIIQSALTDAIRSADYMEVDEGSAGLAAIEVINLLKGNGPSDAPEHVMEWVHQNENTNLSDILQTANSALEKIDNSETSEVAGLWLESGHNWSGMILDIKARLNA